ncbi:acyltransferase [uncultured Tistrella sp.]|uniref:acyltransferase family protein n=1 Tax=Tistrella mobilis TaxID=171437 RepID=UPI000C09DE6A|nr:acyltransferase [uncultured Tistrella sp.]MAM74694.1 acyltransferase [Tistrella sp.]
MPQTGAPDQTSTRDQTSTPDQTGALARNDHIQSLTPLRGIAALWVVVYHFSFQYLPNIRPEALTEAIGKGYLAVDLFFMLSGFVITHVYHRSFTADPPGRYRDFVKARIARLYPLHLAVLGLFVATTLGARAMDYALTGHFEMIPVDGARSISALVANLFMLQGLKASELSWNYPAWSISLEFIAYLIFPLLLPRIWSAPRAARFALAGLLYAALAWFAWDTGDDFNQWNGPQTLLRCLPEFLLGSLLYAAFRDGGADRLLGRDAAGLFLLGLTLACLHLGAPDLVTVTLFAGLILALVANRGLVARALNIRPLDWLGRMSYALYLIHGFVQYAATRIITDLTGAGREALSPGWSLVTFAIMTGVSLALAHPAHHRIEITGRRGLRRLLGIDRQPAAA